MILIFILATVSQIVVFDIVAEQQYHGLQFIDLRPPPRNPFHTFDSIVGVYQVTLIASDINNCSDTTFHQVWVNDEYYIYIPSSFTPDWDGINDKLCLYYHAIRESTFVFKVYNLRGDVVFYTDNLKEMVCDNFSKNGWEGTHNKSGKELSIDNYVYEVYFQDFDGWRHHDFGFLYLIR